MDREPIQYEPIGTIRSPFDSVDGMPIQASAAQDTPGTVELDPAFADGLDDLAVFSHCILVYHFHRASDGAAMHVQPFLDEDDRGVFATRAPRRPNGIGFSVVAVDGREGATLSISGVDVLDGTPLLDVKPYVPDFDDRPDAETGWLDDVRETAADVDADARFRE